MGAKAMIHTIAGKARGFPIKSIGTMMDEPFTGLVYLKDSGITSFKDIKGRKIGYVGEFGKVQVGPAMGRSELPCADLFISPLSSTSVCHTQSVESIQLLILPLQTHTALWFDAE